MSETEEQRVIFPHSEHRYIYGVFFSNRLSNGQGQVGHFEHSDGHIDCRGMLT